MSRHQFVTGEARIVPGHNNAPQKREREKREKKSMRFNQVQGERFSFLHPLLPLSNAAWVTTLGDSYRNNLRIHMMSRLNHKACKESTFS